MHALAARKGILRLKSKHGILKLNPEIGYDKTATYLATRREFWKKYKLDRKGQKLTGESLYMPYEEGIPVCKQFLDGG